MILLGTALLLLNKKLATRAISAGHLASSEIKDSYSVFCDDLTVSHTCDS